jgi:CheY-like chemotaxis protein
MHGGTVRADSEGPGKGATFKIALPLAPSPTQSKMGMPILRNQGFDLPDLVLKLSGVRILVVDDQVDARELMSTILHMQAADIRTADSMAEALKILSLWQPDIVISDIAMPGGDGYELIRRMRISGYTMPAISLTAHAGAEDRIRALTAGFQMHLPKPVEPHELVISVANLTGRLSRD